MPKQVTINPAEMRAKGTIEFAPIPVNQYDRTVTDELAAGNVRKEDLLRIQRDMMLIRTFENMLDSVKKQGHYRDIKYDHRGPAHLSMGQEAAAVGQAFLLGVDDHIYGSHRSHGEILAKGLSAIQKLDDNSLMDIMRKYFDGQCLRVVEKDAAGDVKALAIDYLIYGALAEIFAREAGLQGPRRFDARVFSALWDLSEQRHCRWFRRHFCGCGAVQARAQAARHRDWQHR